MARGTVVLSVAILSAILFIVEKAASSPPDMETRFASDTISRQTKAGGWPKGEDGPATIDNGATTREMRLLASAVTAGCTTCRDSFLKGLDWLLAAQYSNGGWPQVFPLAGGYHDRITFNDDAMVNVLLLLREVSRAGKGFAFLDAVRRSACREAVRRGVDCILRSQVQVAGARTVWCQQHDERDFKPRPGRSFEPAALAATESARVVRFLMDEAPSPPISAAIESAVAWFERARLPGGRWARFYEIPTGRAVFCGRDGIVRYRLEEIEEERRLGYSWFTDRPAKLLSRDFPKWRNALGGRQ